MKKKNISEQTKAISWINKVTRIEGYCNNTTKGRVTTKQFDPKKGIPQSRVFTATRAGDHPAIATVDGLPRSITTFLLSKLLKD